MFVVSLCTRSVLGTDWIGTIHLFNDQPNNGDDTILLHYVDCQGTSRTRYNTGYIQTRQEGEQTRDVPLRVRIQFYLMFWRALPIFSAAVRSGSASRLRDASSCSRVVLCKGSACGCLAFGLSSS